MRERIRVWLRRWRVVIVVLALCLLLGQGGLPMQDLQTNLETITAGLRFNFFTWEVRALAGKVAYGLLSPQRYMSDEAQSRFVLSYLDDVAESNRLSREIDHIYTDPSIEDPEAASADVRASFAALRLKMDKEGPIAEAILQSQVSQVLANGGLGEMASILPPVEGTFTPLPYVLVVSPRAVIESLNQQQLVAGLTAAQQNDIETAVMDAEPDMSAYVTDIGGLAAYPAMLLESSSIDWVTNVVSHEWTHHYLEFHPLGWNYMRSSETRTINETTAELIGGWAGQQVMLRYYDPLLDRTKELPQPLVAPASQPGGGGDGFDFNAEMHHTRVVVDGLLAEGKVKLAEQYMELQRRYFVDNGYQIRRLNQAYFAFHGAYASTPGGAAGADPIGPLVRRMWALSAEPSDFLRSIAPVTSLQQLQSVVDREQTPA